MNCIFIKKSIALSLVKKQGNPVNPKRRQHASCQRQACEKNLLPERQKPPKGESNIAVFANSKCYLGEYSRKIARDILKCTPTRK